MLRVSSAERICWARSEGFGGWGGGAGGGGEAGVGAGIGKRAKGLNHAQGIVRGKGLLGAERGFFGVAHFGPELQGAEVRAGGVLTRYRDPSDHVALEGVAVALGDLVENIGTGVEQVHSSLGHKPGCVGIGGGDRVYDAPRAGIKRAAQRGSGVGAGEKSGKTLLPQRVFVN